MNNLLRACVFVCAGTPEEEVGSWQNLREPEKPLTIAERNVFCGDHLGGI